MSLAENLRNLRKSRRWTQRILSMASGVTSETISRIESGNAGNPNEATLRCLANALDTTIKQLKGE